MLPGMSMAGTETKRMMTTGKNGRVTTTFDKIEVGQRCRVMLRGKVVEVERIPWVKSGSTAFNARRTTGGCGRTFVYTDRIVEVS